MLNLRFMRFPILSFLLLATSSWLLTPAIPVFAQTSSPPPSPSSEINAVHVVPLVYAEGLSILAPDAATLTGSFNVRNSQPDTVGGLLYDVLILSPALPPQEGVLTPDDATTYARLPQSKVFSLKPNETSLKIFSLPLPHLPKGDYRVRVQLKTVNDREMGWADAPLNFGSATAFATLLSQEVQVKTTDPLSKEERSNWGPLEGPNVDPDQPLTLVTTAANQGQKPLIATATVSSYRLFSETQPTITTLPDKITIPADQKPHDISLPLKALPTPGAYRILVTLTDDLKKTVSSEAEFRYVTRGPSASIVKVELKQPAFKTGDTLTANFVIVGPADRATNLQGKLETAVLDEDQIVATATDTVTLNMSAVPGTVSFKLDKPVTKLLGLRLTIKSDQGDTLATTTVRYSELTPPKAEEGTEPTTASAKPLSRLIQNYRLYMIAALVVLFLLLLIAYLVYRKRQHRWIPPTLLLLTATASLYYLLSHPMFATASGIQYRYVEGKNDWPLNVSFFVNSPSHGSSFSSDQLPYSARLAWVSCDNRGQVEAMAVLTRSGHLNYSPYNHPELVDSRFVGHSLWRFSDEVWGWRQGHRPTYFNSAWVPQSGVYNAYGLTGRHGTVHRGFTYDGVINNLPGGPITIFTRAGAYVNSVSWGFVDVVDDFTHLIYRDNRHAPHGTHETTSCTNYTGWACDNDNPNQHTAFDVWADRVDVPTNEGRGQHGTGTYLGRFATNMDRPDVSSQCGGGVHHGINFPLPDSLKDGKPHTLWLYGIDNNIGGSAGNWLLNNSPQSLQCNPLPAPAGLTAACPSPGTTVTLAWNPAPGAIRYLLRVDNTQNGWNSDCNPQLPGDICTTTANTTASLAVEPGGNYRWWVYADNDNNDSILSDRASGTDFACSQSAATPTPTATPPPTIDPPSPTPSASVTPTAPLKPGVFEEVD